VTSARSLVLSFAPEYTFVRVSSLVFLFATCWHPPARAATWESLPFLRWPAIVVLQAFPRSLQTAAAGRPLARWLSPVGHVLLSGKASGPAGQSASPPHPRWEGQGPAAEALFFFPHPPESPKMDWFGAQLQKFPTSQQGCSSSPPAARTDLVADAVDDPPIGGSQCQGAWKLILPNRASQPRASDIWEG